MPFYEYGPDLSRPIDPYVELEHIGVPEISALDVDRTLVVTSKAMDRIINVAGDYGISATRIAETQEQIENGGGTFAPYDALTDIFKQTHPESWQEQMQQVRHSFVHVDNMPILYAGEDDDAEMLLDILRAAPALPSLLLTSAANIDWQANKVATIDWPGYTEMVPAVTIIDQAGQEQIVTPPKGPVIANWRGPTGTYDFVGMNKNNEPTLLIAAQRVSLLDDKPLSFQGLPEDAKAILIRRPSEVTLKSQQGELPTSIRHQQRIERLGQYIANLPAIFEASADYLNHPLAVETVAFVPARRWGLAA